MLQNRQKRKQQMVTLDGKPVTKARVIVLEALQMQGKEGATKQELLTLIGEEIGGERPLGAIGQSIGRLMDDQEVAEVRGRYYLTDCAPQEHGGGPAPYASNGTFAQMSPVGGNGKLAPFALKRKGKRVSVYSSPRTYADVIDVSLLIDGRWLAVPVFDPVRICIGEIPEWHPDQRWWNDVETVKFIRENGKVSEEHPAPKDYVTIAPE